MLKGIIFDMDGTITLSESLHHRAFAEVFRDYGIEYPFETHMSRFAGAGSKKTFTEIFKEHGIDESEVEKCIERKRRLYTKFVHETEIPAVAGVIEFLKRIEVQGLKKIIATGNADLDIVRFILHKVGVLQYFPEIISITEVAHGKPAPDVFVEAAKRMGLALDECLVLEDSVNGVLSAQAAGIRCIAFETTTPREKLIQAGASAVIKDYNELSPTLLDAPPLRGEYTKQL